MDLGVKSCSAGVADVLDGLTAEVSPNGGFKLSLSLGDFRLRFQK
jgi:hypothetical protein